MSILFMAFSLIILMPILLILPWFVVRFMVESGKRLDRLAPLRQFASNPGRRLLEESGMDDTTAHVMFSQGTYRLRLAQLGPPRMNGTRLLECSLILGLMTRRAFFFEATTHGYPTADLSPMLLGRQQATELFLPRDDELGGFTIVADDHERAEALLDARFRLALRQLGELFNNHGASLGLDSRMVVVRTICAIRNSIDLEHFFHVASTVFECILERLGAPSLLDDAVPFRAGGPILPVAKANSLHLAAPDDVRLLPPSLQDGEHGICQVCGDRLGSDLVWCASCGTPHHRDCWQFNERCAIFGCQCTRSTTVRPRDTSHA